METTFDGPLDLPGEPDETCDLTILVPMYNEIDGVRTVMTSILHEMRGLPIQTELVAVDDGSTDGTSKVLSEFASRATIVRHPENKGYGSAIKSGTAIAKGKWVCLLDADNTYPIGRLGDLWTRCGPDIAMVVGARIADGAKIPWVRRPAKWVLRRFASALTGRSIPDLNSGFRIYKRSHAEDYLPLLPDGFSFTSTITIAFISDGLGVEYVPIAYHSRTGRSKIRPIKHTYEFFMLVLKTSVFFAPLRFFSPLAFSFMALSACLVVYRALIGAAFGVVSILLFVTGLQLLALGLLADLVNRRLNTIRRD